MCVYSRLSLAWSSWDFVTSNAARVVSRSCFEMAAEPARATSRSKSLFGLVVVGLGGIKLHLVIAGINLDQKLAFFDVIIVVDQDALDRIGKLGADGHHVSLDEGIVGRFVVERVDIEVETHDQRDDDDHAETETQEKSFLRRSLGRGLLALVIRRGFFLRGWRGLGGFVDFFRFGGHRERVVRGRARLGETDFLRAFMALSRPWKIQRYDRRVSRRRGSDVDRSGKDGKSSRGNGRSEGIGR